MFGMGPRTFVGAELFTRRWKVTIATDATGGFSFDGLDIKFQIEKSTKDKPNTCELEVWNLTEDHRAAIEELLPKTDVAAATLKEKQKRAIRKQATEGIPVKIEAGLGEEGDLSLLWLGDLRTVFSVREGPDWVTKFESGDGEKAYANARVNVSYGPKTPVETVLRAIVKTLKLGEGNIASVLKDLEISGVGKLYPQGTVISGPSARHIQDFCRSADLEWSIQDGTPQFINRGKKLEGEAIKVSAESGMLDSPTVDIDGILTVKMLLVPDLRPGRLLVMDALRIKGNYRIDKITFSGDSAGNDWGAVIQASRY